MLLPRLASCLAVAYSQAGSARTLPSGNDWTRWDAGELRATVDHLRQEIRRPLTRQRRLMPSVEKRARDIHKKLDRMAGGSGWGVFASNAAWSVQNGKAPVRRKAELSLLNEAARWRRDVQRSGPERPDEFDRLLRDSLKSTC